MATPIALALAFLSAVAFAGETTFHSSQTKDGCPPKARTLNGQGLAHLGAKRYDAAIAAFTESLGLCKANPTAFSNRGIAYHHSKKPDLAIADTEQALNLLKGDPGALKLILPTLSTMYVARGRARVDASQGEAAVGDFRKAIQLDPKNAAPHAEMAFLMAQAGKFPECVAEATAGVQADPKFSDSYANRGACLVSLGKLPEATADLERAIAIAPTPEMYVQRAGLYAAAGKCAPARIDAATAVRLQPGLAPMAKQMMGPCGGK